MLESAFGLLGIVGRIGWLLLVGLLVLAVRVRCFGDITVALWARLVLLFDQRAVGAALGPPEMANKVRIVHVGYCFKVDVTIFFFINFVLVLNNFINRLWLLWRFWHLSILLPHLIFLSIPIANLKYLFDIIWDIQLVAAFHLNFLLLLWNLIQLFESLSVLFILATVFQNVDDVQEILVADQRKVGGWLLRLEVVGDEVGSECLYSQDFIFEID